MAASVRKRTVEWAICLFIVISSVIGDVDYEGAGTFILEHAFESGANAVWLKRGAINVRSLKPGRTQINQPTGPTNDETSQLIDAVRNSGVYRVRVAVRAHTNGESDPSALHYVSSFTLACAMYESRLSDYITLNLDQSGEATGISIVTYPGSCSGATLKESDLIRYNTTVEIAQAVVGPTPDTQTYVERMKKDEMDRAKGQQQDNRSFFAKYWMYIVPGVIIVLLMNSMDPQAGGGGGGR